MATRHGLGAPRAAVELLGARAPGGVLSKGSPLASALDELQLESDTRRRVEIAVEAEVEREGLRRYSGAVLAWVGEPERNLGQELRRVRACSEDAQLHLQLSLPAPADAEQAD